MRSRSGMIWRLLHIALAAAVLASSGFHFHPKESFAGHWEPAEPDVQVRSAASHPESPLHIESVELESAQRCLDCLLRHRDHALAGPGPALLDLASTIDVGPRHGPRQILRRAGEPGRPRGPPSPLV